MQTPHVLICETEAPLHALEHQACSLQEPCSFLWTPTIFKTQGHLT